MDGTRGQNRDASEPDLNPLLLTELYWIVRLRWAAGAAVVLLDLAQWRWLGWYEQWIGLLITGLCVLIFNLGMWGYFLKLQLLAIRPRLLTVIASTQVLFDLACLTALVVMTGGVLSPIVGFFVFHMVFASTLLTNVGATATALTAIAMLGVGLSVTDQWSDDRQSLLVAGGWAITLLLSASLAGRLARGLRRRERRLVEQNREIREMSDRLRDQQQAMIQHEKMVALGRLSAGVAHEVANPLASMDSVLQLMERHPEKPRESAVRDLRSQIQRIHEIVRGMTRYAHQDPGSIVVRDVNEVVRTSLDMISFDRRLQSVSVQLDLSASTGRAQMIPQALQQVLINLVLNALDAMNETEQPRLDLKTRGEHGWAIIEVEDNGHGIAPEIQARIFEPFFTTKVAGEGTGLGLSICFSLVRDQGGKLKVESDSGRTVFSVALKAENRAGSFSG